MCLPDFQISANFFSFFSYGTDVYLHLNRLSSSSEPLQ